MQSITVETKMSDIQVVQTVLDFWDPYCASIYRSSTLNQIDEYDSYSFPILDLLRKNVSEYDIFQFLNQTQLTRGALSGDENESINRFFAWAFLQTWRRHQSKETNIRFLHIDSVQLPDDEFRLMSRLELLQQYLQQWDPLEASKHWLFGADTLNQYDEASIALDEAVASRNINEVCFALEVACLRIDDGIPFALENHSLNSENLQEKYHLHLIEKSKRHRDRANFLVELLGNAHNSVRRRVHSRKIKD
jgi:hypothetical protein